MLLPEVKAPKYQLFQTRLCEGSMSPDYPVAVNTGSQTPAALIVVQFDLPNTTGGLAINVPYAVRGVPGGLEERLNGEVEVGVGDPVVCRNCRARTPKPRACPCKSCLIAAALSGKPKKPVAVATPGRS